MSSGAFDIIASSKSFAPRPESPPEGAPPARAEGAMSAPSRPSFFFFATGLKKNT